MRISYLTTYFLLPVLLIASGIPSRSAVAKDCPAEAVGELFEGDVLADNVFGLRDAAKRLPVEARYEILKSHLVPGKLHREFRLLGKLTSTDPPELATFKHLVDVARLQAGIEQYQRRSRTGGVFVSPVFDLIAAAKETGKLDELRFAVQAATVSERHASACQYDAILSDQCHFRLLGTQNSSLPQVQSR